MSSSTRTLRNRSSPATFTDNAPELQETIEVQRQGQNENGQSGSSSRRGQEQWVEPTIRQGTASFEDVKGLERVGVLEHMQPLGSAPNQKLLQKLKVNFPRFSMSARATPAYSEGVESPGVEPTRDDLSSPTIDPELLLDAPPINPTSLQNDRPVLSQPAERPSQPSPAISLHLRTSSNGNSKEIIPQPSAVIMSPPRGRPAKREVEEMRVYGDDPMLSPALAASSSRPARASPRNPSNHEQQKGEKFRSYLQNAITRARMESRYDVASGLTKVLHESNRDELMTALDNITKYKTNVRIEQFKVFKHYVKKGIRKYRRNSFHSTDDNEASPLQPIPQLQRPVAYVSSFHANIRRPSVMDSALTDDAPSNYSSNRSPPTFTLNKIDHVHEAPTRKLSLNSPSQTEYAMADEVDEDSGNFSQLPTKRSPTKMSPHKRRSSSTSSLSSIISVPSDYAPPTNTNSNIKNEEQGAEARPIRAASMRQAPTRAASHRTTRASAADPDSAEQSQSDLQNIRSMPNTGNKRSKITHAPTYVEETPEVKQRREELQQATVQDYNYIDVPESNLRDRYAGKKSQKPKGPPAPRIHPHSLIHATVEVSSPATTEFPQTNGTSRKRNFDQFAYDNASSRLSSPASSPRTSPGPEHRMLSGTQGLSQTARSSRASTPRVAKSAQIAKTRKGPRMMNSPRKPKTGANSAAATRAGITQDSAVANGIDTNGEEQQNEDQCRACGDEGSLLLCDGCPNSFHADCVEPPVNLSDIQQSDEPWFCPECEARRKPEGAVAEGLLGPLIRQMDNAPPKMYNLPGEIRHYFDYVKTGEQGEYVEVPAPINNKKGAARVDNNGVMKPPPYKDVRDKHGNLRRCYMCGLGTGGERDIIPCDFCPNEWHLDCLKPPSAVPPRNFSNPDKPPPPWRCPLHVEHDLVNYGRPAGAEIGQLGKRPRLRRPKVQNSGSKGITRPVLTNNGVIDVQLEPEIPDFNVREVEMNGHVMKLPEKQIVMDFITKAKWDYYNDFHIKVQRGIDSQQNHAKSWTPDNPRFRDNQTSEKSPKVQLAEEEEQAAQDQDARARFYNKSFLEQKTLVALLDFSRQTDDLDDDDRRDISNLADRLTGDAPPEVTDMIQLSEIEQLEKLERILNQRLAMLKRNPTSAITDQDQEKQQQQQQEEKERQQQQQQQQDSDVVIHNNGVNGTLEHKPAGEGADVMKGGEEIFLARWMKASMSKGT